MNCVRWSIGEASLHGMGTSLVPGQCVGCHPCPWTKLLPMCPARTQRGLTGRWSGPAAPAAQRLCVRRLVLENSVLKRTGQLWKIGSTICVVLVGGALLFYGIATDASKDHGLTWILAGILLTFAGLFFACIAVRCPTCRARWVGLAVSERSSGTYGTWLVALSACPKCGA